MTWIRVDTPHDLEYWIESDHMSSMVVITREDMATSTHIRMDDGHMVVATNCPEEILDRIEETKAAVQTWEGYEKMPGVMR